MPKGVYPRTANQLAAAPANLAKGREAAARAKATVRLREIAADPAWRDKVGDATKAAMHRPDVRARHLAGLKGQPSNFKGGNGQAPTPFMSIMGKALSPLGFVAELPIRTAGHGTEHRPPTVYKADYGNSATKVAFELDSQSHRNRAQQAKDRKKTEVLEALGWTVIRIRH